MKTDWSFELQWENIWKNIPKRRCRIVNVRWKKEASLAT